MIDRVIEKDIFSIQSFNTETRNTISRILSFLALQSPGGTSDAKLSERLGVSPTMIRSILDVLEKTHLIFSIKPYGGAGKIVRKPWKYYFLSPSINSAIRFKLGAFDRNSKDMFGVLIESMVASYLLRMRETINLPTGIFYDSDDGGPDFIIQDAKENVIPIEVGSGKKDKGQVERAIANIIQNTALSSMTARRSEKRAISFIFRLLRFHSYKQIKMPIPRETTTARATSWSAF